MNGLDRYFTVFLIVFSASFLALGAFYYEYNWTVLRFPLGAGLAVILLGGTHLWLRRHDDTHDPDAVPVDGESAVSMGTRGHWTRIAHGAVWMVAVLPVIFSLGYVTGLPLYTFVYMKRHGLGWRVATILSLATLALIYVGFVKILGVPLPLYPVGFGR